MKQVLQSFKTGELTVIEVPAPTVPPRGLLVRTAASLVSAGTERMVVDFAEKNLLQKAQARPDLARQVVEKASREGVLTTLDSVRNRLDQSLPLGYSAAGTVIGVGGQTEGFRVGDRVACAGSGHANHAEIIAVPRNLAVRLPADVSFEAGAFATLGAIALQGIRQADVVLGHRVAVIGLGLVGQLTVQLLKAAGCRVFGIDLVPDRIALARSLGADNGCLTEAALAEGIAFTDGRGFDAVLITADTKSDEPVQLAGELARDRAVVVAVGAVGLTIPRKSYYEKELDFRLSRSYGPGRYDLSYEEGGQDYPYGYVRWTEGRNLDAFVDQLRGGGVRVEPLITHRFPIGEATKGYDVITGKTAQPFLAVILTYERDASDAGPQQEQRIALKDYPPEQTTRGATRLGMLGAGLFANATLLPALRQVPGLDLIGIASGSGMSARTTGDRFGFDYCATSQQTLLADERINWLAIATRHDLHAQQALAGMEAGKDVFVEKPLALNRAELLRIVRAQYRTGRRLMVGFNRRFAPQMRELARFLADHHRPLVATYRVNAGPVPHDHWTRDRTIGGGRIIGEVCHFIDALQFLIGAAPTRVSTQGVQTETRNADDEVVVLLTFADGSIGTILYSAGGDRAFGKERIEVLGDGRVAVLDDFRQLEMVRDGRRVRKVERLRPDKGHRGEWEAIVTVTQSGSPAPISLREIVATHLATFAALDSLQHDRPVAVDAGEFWSEVAAGSAGADRDRDTATER